MSNSAWFMYYSMYLSSQQALKQSEQKRKEAEEELLKAKTEAKQAQEQLEQMQNTQSPETPQEEAPEEVVETTTPTVTTTASTPDNSLPRTDCEYLYEVGSSDYATCENTRMLVQQHNSNIAAIMLSTIAIGIALALFIIRCIDEKVVSKYNDRSKGIYM